jgi:predicted nucleic acid-binding protein
VAVTVYLDASVLVSLFASDSMTSRADAFLQSQPSVLIVSDFAAAEFASAIARDVRTKTLTADDAKVAFSIFDAWILRETERVHITSADISTAVAWLRRLDLPIRAPDAINIAIAQRVNANLFTFDKQMAENARVLGMNVAAG